MLTIDIIISSLPSQARLKLLPHKTGQLHVLGVVYNLGTGEDDNTGEGI